MEKYTFRHQYNYEPGKHSFEYVSGESETIPGQALTVREMLDNYVKGVPLDGLYHHGSFEDDPDYEDFDPTSDPAFDIVDAHQQLEQIKENSVTTETTQTPSPTPPTE